MAEGAELGHYTVYLFLVYNDAFFCSLVLLQLKCMLDPCLSL